MIHIKNTKKIQLNSTERTAVALGKFDGIHQGHMLLIEQVLKLQKQGYMGVVFTFDMRENHVFDVSNMKTIYTSEEKAQVVSDTGVDVLVEYPFDDAFAATEPEAFIRDILVGMMRAGYVVVGSDYRFGRDRKGDVETLKSHAEEYGYKVIVIDKLEQDDEVVSSTVIRRNISEGDVRAVIPMLGRPYSMTGEVVSGKQLGRTIGIPTANMLPQDHKLYPPAGVYASRIKIVKGEHADHEDPFRMYMGITNIGDNPTVNDNGNITIETNIFDFDRDIYGNIIKVELIQKIRGEKKFAGIEELKKQMSNDIDAAKKIIADSKLVK